MIRQIYFWGKMFVFIFASILLVLITPTPPAAAVQIFQGIPTSVITSTIQGPIQAIDSEDNSNPLGTPINPASPLQALLTSVLPTMSTPLSALLFSINNSFTSISTAGLLETVEATSVKAAALTEAKFLLGEGDRTANKTEAREKWLAAADAFALAGDYLGVADAYLRLADSYQFEAFFDRQKLKLTVEYYLKAITAGADVYEAIVEKELALDQPTIKEAEALYKRGQTFYTAGDCAQALPLLDQARQRYRQAKLGSGEVRVLTIKAICQMEAENYLGSLSTLLEGLLIVQSLPMGEPLTERYLDGTQRYEQGDFAEARAIYEEVLTIYQDRNDKESTSEILLNLGNTHAQLGDYGQATEAYQQALGLFLELQDRNALSDTVVYAFADYNEAATRHNLGNLATIDGRYTEAVDQLEQAIALWQVIGEPANEVISMSSMGLALRGLGNYDEALAVLEQAWHQQQRLSPNSVTEGDIRSNIGYIYYSQGDFQQALQEFELVAQLRRRLPQSESTRKEAETLNNIAAVYASLSRFDDALKIYQQVLNLLPENAPPIVTAPVHANMAAIYIEQGNYQEGIAVYIDLLPALTHKSMKPMRATILQNLGTAYLRIGGLAVAETYLLQAQAIFNETGDSTSVATINNNLGLFYAQAGYPISATVYLEKAVVVFQTEENQASSVKVLGNLALAAVAQDDLTAAITYGEEALILSEKIGIPTDQARILVILGLIHLQMGDITKALEYGERARILSIGVGDLQTEIGSQILLAISSLLQGEVAQAYTQIEVAIARLKVLQNLITVSDLKTAFLGKVGSIYDLAILIAIAHQQPTQAFLYAESSRAQASLLMLSNRRVDFRQNAQTDLLQHEQSLRQQMINLQNDLSIEKAKPSSQQRVDAINNWQVELETTRREHSQLLIELQASDPAYADLDTGAVLSLSKVQQTLDDQTTLIVYFLPDSTIMDKSLAWVIDRETVEFVPLEANAVDIEVHVRFLHALLAERADDVEIETTAIYQTLFAPLVPYIHHKNLVIIPHGGLHYLPFATLQDPESGHYLVEDYTITYAPSASILPLIFDRRNPNQDRLLALGNPGGWMPYAETEVNEAANLYGTTPLIGQQATERQIYDQAIHADILHLATSAMVDTFNPLYSRVELAPDSDFDGNLEVHEVLGLNLNNANLVVLSGSETAVEQLSSGDDIVGLRLAFLYAGAPSVISTLWNVDDAASSELIRLFFRHLRAGSTIAEAIRVAQIEIMNNEQWRSPYYWASFNLTGDYLGDEPELLEARKQLTLLQKQIQQNSRQPGILSDLFEIQSTFNHYESPLGESGTHFGMSDIYLQRGELALAEKHIVQALNILKKADISTEIDFALESLGWFSAQAGDFAEAEMQLQQLLGYWQENQNPLAVTPILEKLFLISIAKGDPETALYLIQNATQQGEQANLQVERASLRLIKGIAWFNKGEYSNAQKEANHALQLSADSNDQLSLMGSHTLLSMIAIANNDFQLALDHLQPIITSLDTSQTTVTPAQLQIAFLYQLADINHLAISLAIKLGKNNQAFQYAEQLRKPGFLELNSQRFDVRANADPDMIRRDQMLRQQITDLEQEIQTERNKPLGQQQVTKLNARQNDLENIRSDYIELLNLLKAANSSNTSSTKLQLPTLQQVQKELLDEKTTLVRYLVTDQETLAWVITRNEVNMIQIPLTRQTLMQQIQFLRDQVAVRELDSSVAAILYDALWAPLKKHIRFSNLVIVPDELLHNLPFAALWDADNQRYLVQDYALTQIPSVSALSHITGLRNPNLGRLLVMGNPDGSLPYAEQEAKEIATLYNTEPLLRQQATERDLYAKANQSDILHLAAHGVHDSLYPLFSYIELASGGNYDGKLEVHEVYNQLDLQGVNLVVVTTDDAQPASNNNDGFTGFAQAFLYAGTPNVMTSQWTVADEATAFLMKQFYTYLKDGIDTPEALRLAQADTLEQPGFAEPYYWAGFTLIGDYKNDYAVAITPPSSWPLVAGVGSGLVLMFIAGFVTLARYSGLPVSLLLQQKSDLPFVGLQYRSYRQRWENQATLSQLLLLLFPKDETVDAKQLAAALATRTVPVEIDQIEQELHTIYRSGLVKLRDRGYQPTEPRLNRALQMHVGQDTSALLAQQIRNEHPLSVNTQRFFKQAGCSLTLVAEPLIFRCDSIPLDLQRLLSLPVYMQLLLGQTLDGDKILAIQNQVKKADPDASLVLVVTDQRPTNDGWAQIGVQQMREFTILPLESALINEGIANGQERKQLYDELEERLGSDYDPYDVRNPVAGSFSFFGREPLVDTLLRRITNGQPVGIFGLRKLGKTSLLHAVRDRAPFPVAAINLQAGGVYQRILRQWTQWARVHYQLEWLPPPVTEDNANTFIAATLDLLDRVERIQTNVRLGLFLDEVESIVPQADGSGPSLTHYLSLFRALRGLIDEDGRLSLVVASLNPTLNRVNAWYGEQNPTFSLFQEINLPPLTDEDCIQMVLNIGQQIGLVYTDAALVTISELSGGHPFLARQLCSTLYKLRGRQVGQVEESEIPLAAERFIYDDATAQHLDEGIWQDVGNEKLWGVENAKLNQTILLELARAGEPQSIEIILNGGTDTRQSALINLEKFQVIYQPEPGAYAIRFGLLQKWLRRRVLGLS